MLGQPKTNQKQLSLFGNSLLQLLNPNDSLIILADGLSWHKLEARFKHLYSHTGAPSHPIRRMLGLLLLQHMFKLSDERIVEVWKQNPYYQYFTGEAEFQWYQPCASSDLVHFRKRLGEEGIRILFAVSVGLHGSEVKKAQEVIVDTTVQEKNISFPTDAKLYKKVIDTCNKVAQKSGVKLRQSYKFVSKKLMYVQRYISNPMQKQQAKKAVSKLKTIAGRQVRDLTRGLKEKGKTSLYAALLSNMDKIVTQHRNSKDKIYSLHEPMVSCIAKGKKHKKYEFGSKVSLASLPSSQVIVGIQSHQGNPHDSKTLLGTLDEVAKITGKRFKRVLLDRGYKGVEKKLKGEQAILPGCKSLAKGSYSYQIHKQRCRRRSGIECLISHLKNHHKLGRNYLKGVVGDINNSLLAAIGHNMQLILLTIERHIRSFIVSFFFVLSNRKKTENLGNKFILYLISKIYLQFKLSS